MTRFKTYTKDEVRELFIKEGLRADERTYMVAIDTEYINVGDDGSILAYGPVTAYVYEVAFAPTGVLPGAGNTPTLLFLNTEHSVLDYDLIAEMHKSRESSVYLWLLEPWEDTYTDVEVLGEWCRRDIYKDGMQPFNKTLGWEDQPPKPVEEI